MKTLISILFFALITASLCAQSTFEVEYKKEPVTIDDMLALLNISRLDVEIKGDFAAKKLYLDEYIVYKDSVSTKISPYPLPLTDSVFSLKVLARSVKSDSVIMIFNYKNMTMTRSYSFGNILQYILMETETENVSKTQVPLLAYTRGITKQITFNSQIHNMVDFCALRDQKIHPAQWRETSNVYPYVYFVLRIE